MVFFTPSVSSSRGLVSFLVGAAAVRMKAKNGHSCQEFARQGPEAGGILERGYGLPPGAQLGNHMFMYAGAFGVAYANGMELRHRTWPADKSVQPTLPPMI